MSRADPETLRKLASLGYLTGAAPEPRGASALPAPRRRVGLYNDLIRARSLVEQRDFSGAERRLRAILAADPQIVDAETALGSLYLQQRKFAEAARRLADEALALDPRTRGAHYCRAVVLEQQGRPDAAWEEYALEVRVAPNDGRPFRELMILSRRLGRLSPEAEILKEVQRLHPE